MGKKIIITSKSIIYECNGEKIIMDAQIKINKCNNIHDDYLLRNKKNDSVENAQKMALEAARILQAYEQEQLQEDLEQRNYYALMRRYSRYSTWELLKMLFKKNYVDL